MISQELPFTNNAIQVYAYEGFQYTISNSNLTYTLQPVSNSTGLNPTSLYFTKNGNTSYTFAISDTSNNLTAGTVESFVLTTVSGTNTFTSSNTVNIGPGRFLDACGNSLSNNAYVFYKNEPITPIVLVAPSFTLKTPTSIPFLPPGLSFVRDSSSIFRITGTPTVTVPNNSYQIIGVQQGGSKIVTTRFNMAISNERLRMNLSGTPIISGMQIGTDISSRVITAIPPVGSNTVRYTFPALPDGIVVQDKSGNTFSGITSFTPTDPSYTMIIAGTPTLAAAEFFRNSGADASGVVYTIRGSRTAPLPILENSQELTFAFGETILFDTPVLSSNYTGIPIDPSLNYFGARTYFSSNAPITNIFSSNLASVDPSLSLVFDASLSRAYLTGTTSVAGTKNFNIRAVNGTPILRDFSASVIISNDAVVFFSPVGDVCVNYIISRPVDQFKPGYYNSNVRFIATANSGRPVTLSAPALSGTGLSLDGTGTIVGIPTTVTPLTSLVVTGSTGTVSNTKTINFAILNDVITLGDVSDSKFNFVQNIPITPFQVPVSNTLSGRNVINYTELNLPTGLSISPAGVISGTPSIADTSGTITITATTGFASGSKTYTFRNEPDTILFTVPQDDYVYTAGSPVVIPVTGVAYSGTTVSNYVLTLPAPYGLSIQSSSGLITGEWTDSIPPHQLLPASCNFSITAQAGSLSGVLPASFTASPIIQNTSFVWVSGQLYAQRDGSWNQPSGLSTVISNAFDIQLRNSNVDGNTILFAAGDRIYRSTNSAVFSEVIVRNMSNNQYVSSLAAKPVSTTWWASGTRDFGGIQKANILRSDDNGITWNSVAPIKDSSTGRELLSRDSNAVTPGTNPYLSAGVALKYKDGVMLAGGIDQYPRSMSSTFTILRSIDEGLTWNSTFRAGFTGTNTFRECAYLSVDVSGMWIATGGSGDTIQYSTDQGVGWFTSGGTFNHFAYELVYARVGLGNVWMATGVDLSGINNYIVGLKYSTNGTNWSNVDLSLNNLAGLVQFSPQIAPLPIGSMNYDGSNWNVLVHRYNSNTSTYVSEVYSSPTPTGPWVARDITADFPDAPTDSSRRFVTYTRPNYLRTAQTKIIDINLMFDTNLGSGPTLTVPSTTSFLVYQYIPVSIPLAATGTGGTIYFFIAGDDLPPGLTFDPLTNAITGKPALTGNFATRVYAKDSNGTTLTVFSFTVNVPRVIRKQDGAGAYTYLLRQYTEVLATQNARDNRALPSQERMLGEFMSPAGPDVVTQPFTTTKCKVCQRSECPTVNEIVDSGEANVAVCDFIDANTTDDTNAIDAGNAQPNVCD
jgi:hypothetical protein